MMGLCPQCGADIALDEPIQIGALRMLPYGAATWDGKPVSLTPPQVSLVWALLKANGVPMSRHALGERMGYEGDYADNLISVQLARVRERFAAVGAVLPIESVRNVGVRWAS